MFNKVGIKIILVIGFAIAGAGVYFAYDSIKKGFSYESAEGIITGFHTHANDREDSYPNVAFLYNGDSIFSKIDYYDGSMEVGGTVTVIFPPGDPESAEIKSSLWFVPLFLFFFSAFFILPSLLSSRSASKDNSTDVRSEVPPTKITQQQEGDKSKKNRGAALIGRSLLTVIAGLLVWLVVYQVQLELSGEYSSTGWEGIIVLSFVALLFSVLSLLGWIGTVVEPFMVEVDAEFVNVTSTERTVSASGDVQYKWKLQCKWNDPRSGRQFTFTSASFQGTEAFYNRSKIRVSILPFRPSLVNDVDLSFISQADHTGIVLVDRTLVAQVEEAAARLKAEMEKVVAQGGVPNDTPLKRNLRPVVNFMMSHRRAIEWGIRLSPVFLVLTGALWWFSVRQVEGYRQSSFEESMVEKIGTRPWKFESDPGREVELVVNGTLVNIPSGNWRFSGETRTFPWTLNTYINSSKGRITYEGYTPSDEERRLDEASVSHWKSSRARLAVGEVLLVVEIPGEYPQELRQQLLAPFFADSISFLDDLILSPHISLLGNYFNTLLRNDYDKVFGKENIERYAYQDGSHLCVVVTNNRRMSDYFVAHKLWSAIGNWSKSVSSTAGILVSEEGLMVATLNPLTEPTQIEEFNELCLALDEKIIRAKYNDEQ